MRDKSELDVLECTNCGLVFLSSFDHMNDNFYEESNMLGGVVDVEKYRKDSNADDERRYALLRDFMLNKSLLDFGCGAGGFLKRANEICSSVAGVELDNTLREYLNEIEHIKVYHNIHAMENEYDIITLFHVLEHLADPIEMLQLLVNHLSSEGRIIVEVPSSNDALLSLYENEPFSHFTYWSCHLFLFNESTLREVAKRAGLKVDYIKHIQRYPLSNHLHWLSKGKPGGHQKWSFLNSPELHAAYEKQLASLGITDTLLAGFSKQQ